MQTRFLVVALAICGLLVVAGVSLSLSPNPAPRPQLPTRPGFDFANEVQSTLEAAPSLDAPDLEPLPTRLSEPPPPPELDNDPAKGRVWLRLIDADTNRPLPNKRIDFVPAGYPGAGTGYGYLKEEPRPEPRRTDEDGLISLSVTTQDEERSRQAEEDDEEGDEDDEERVQQHGAEVVLNPDMSEATFLHVPVPQGWYPLVEPYVLGESICALLGASATKPIDLLVRELASVNVVVRDKWGVPISDARVAVDLFSTERVQQQWLEAFSEHYLHWWDDWADETRRVRMDIGQALIQCRVNGKLMPNAGYDDEALESERFVPAGQFGNLFLKDLPCLRIAVVAAHPLYGTAVASMELQSGRNTLDAFFTEPPNCELRVRFHWQPPPDDPAQEFGLELIRSGAFGVTTPIEDGDSWITRYWALPVGDGDWEAVLTGVPAGGWYVAAGDIYPGAGESVQLAPGESKLIHLYLGKDAQCEWTPIVKCGGERIEDAEFFLLGGAYPYRESVTAYSISGSAEIEPIELSPGTWTVMLPTLPPFTFTLKPGEKRSDVFELKLVNMTFSITSDLASNIGDLVEGGARLNIDLTGTWRDSTAHLLALDARMRAQDEDYDILQPGVTRAWIIPPGEYEWDLYGGDRSLNGRIRVSVDGPKHVVFGLDSLPGYAALEVELVGFSGNEPPDVSVAGPDDIRLRSAPTTWNRSMYLDEPTATQLELFAHYKVELIRLSEDRYVAFGQSGSFIVYIWHETGTRQFLVTAPGKLTVHADQVTESVGTEVHFVEFLRNAEDVYADENFFEDDGGEFEEVQYDIELIGKNGWSVNPSWHSATVPLGAVTAVVHRKQYPRAGGCINGISRFELEVGSKPIVVELGKLTYAPFATLDLVFKGRGSPEQNEDAWWFPEKGPRAPKLIALDAEQRIVDLDYFSEFMPGGRLEFSFRDLLLPPGRYRLIPWPAAPEKNCRVFSLKPGEHSTIVTHGGK